MIRKRSKFLSLIMAMLIGIMSSVTAFAVPGDVSSISAPNILLIGDYAFYLNDPSYTLNNFFTAAQTVYNDGNSNQVYYSVGSAWYDLIANYRRGLAVPFTGVFNETGKYKYYNMKVADFNNTMNIAPTATFAWTAVPGATDVKIQQSPTGAGTWTDSNTEGPLASDSNNSTVTGLTAGTSYDFKLVITGGAFTGSSNVLTVTESATTAVEVINSTTYDASTGNLVLTGLNFNTSSIIDVTKLTIEGQGGTGAQRVLTAATSNPTPTSSTSATVVIAGADLTAVNLILNQSGTSASDSTTYALTAVSGWQSGMGATSAGITVLNLCLFISSWNTNNTSTGSSNNNQVKLPLVSDGNYAFTAYWGDGNSSYITSYNQAEVIHTYAASGTYTIKIDGTCVGWQFNNSGDKLKLLTISQWGTLQLGNSGYYFYGCSNLNITANDVLNLTGTTTLSYMFESCSLLVGTPIMNNWNVSNITDMSDMFNCCYVFNQNISSWNVSNVTSMSDMFNCCYEFNQNISSWNVSNVASMDYMFQECSAFNQNLGSWNVNSVTDMCSMFESCYAFNQNIGGWNVSNVTNIAYMFDGCTAFNQNISGWNVSKVTNMNSMFDGCTAFNQNISSWNVTNVTLMTDMFASVTLSTANYNALLIGWAAEAVKSNVTFSAGSSKYAEGQTARDTLTGTYGWTITDGGYDGTTETINGAIYTALFGNGFQLTGLNFNISAPIDVTKLTITGQGGSTVKLTSATANPTPSDTEHAVMFLAGADATAVNEILTKIGYSASDDTTYNIAAASGWQTGTVTVPTVGISVQNAIEVISSATYDVSTGNLVLTGTNFDTSEIIEATNLTITGQGGSTVTLTAATASPNPVSVTSATVVIAGADKVAVDAILTQNGTTAFDSTTYNVAAVSGCWQSGLREASTIGITVSNAAEVISSATYDASTGNLVLTGLNFNTSAIIDVTKLTITGQGGAGAQYVLTAATSNPKPTSATSATVVITGIDETAVNLILNKNGTISIDSITYNITTASGWQTGATAISTAGVTVSNAT